MFPSFERLLEYKRDYVELQTALVRAALASIEDKALGAHEDTFPGVSPPQSRRPWTRSPIGVIYKRLSSVPSLQQRWVTPSTPASAQKDHGEAVEQSEAQTSHTLSISCSADASTEYSDTEDEFIWDWATIEAHACQDP